MNDLVCFSPVRYLPLSTLPCSSALEKVIFCDESKLHEVADSVTTLYIAIMLPKSGASVHFGMSYFDAQDSIDVVKHEVGLFRAEICDNNSAKKQRDFNAFKPLSGRTKLQYDELNFPTQYLELLHKNSQQFLMPSFHYNIALAYYRQHNIKQANYWLEKSASWESDVSRRKKVRQGDF